MQPEPLLFPIPYSHFSLMQIMPIQLHMYAKQPEPLLFPALVSFFFDVDLAHPITHACQTLVKILTMITRRLTTLDGHWLWLYKY